VDAYTVVIKVYTVVFGKSGWLWKNRLLLLTLIFITNTKQ